MATIQRSFFIITLIANDTHQQCCPEVKLRYIHCYFLARCVWFQTFRILGQHLFPFNNTYNDINRIKIIIEDIIGLLWFITWLFLFTTHNFSTVKYLQITFPYVVWMHNPGYANFLLFYYWHWINMIVFYQNRISYLKAIFKILLEDKAIL